MPEELDGVVIWQKLYPFHSVGADPACHQEEIRISLVKIGISLVKIGIILVKIGIYLVKIGIFFVLTSKYRQRDYSF